MGKMLKSKKLFMGILVALITVFGLSQVGEAATKTFQIKFVRSAVEGKTAYSLANKSTSIFSNARIWNESKKGYNNSKHKYSIQLKEDKLFFGKAYNASFQTPAANTKKLGKISKGSYKVNITKHTYTAPGLGLKGTGKIKQ
ncbi:hypothetical protein QLH48_11785 [Bacillus safensis]|uniref:hypothetical protein n=1 Tax=Bacillus TaxID=1386 RepID=UPI000F78488C|nr:MULTISPECIES: hypothetical protein [Bacillus]MBZ9522455.1 hypothetical protein [Bacillus safensis]MCM3368334.1 hypothetical protein [Bacillus safensis]MDJ0291145.1 hypothetical protein [Bacillus safensis]NMW02968.1 hypothetical protein [Bacillus safensis]